MMCRGYTLSLCGYTIYYLDIGQWKAVGREQPKSTHANASKASNKRDRVGGSLLCLLSIFTSWTSSLQSKAVVATTNWQSTERYGTRLWLRFGKQKFSNESWKMCLLTVMTNVPVTFFAALLYLYHCDLGHWMWLWMLCMRSISSVCFVKSQEDIFFDSI